MSEAKVVETDTGFEVHQSYRRGCHDYTIGFASALSWAANVCGFGILWSQHVPDVVYHVSVIFFVVFSLVAFTIVGIAYTEPVWFYELLEGEARMGDGGDGGE